MKIVHPALTTHTRAEKILPGIAMVGRQCLGLWVRCERCWSGFYLTIIGCSIPPLESQLEGGPRVQDIVEHINCELAPIVQISRTDLRLIDRMEPDLSTPIGRLVGRIQADHSFHRLLRRLIKDHFVASVLMTLDVLDSEGLNPSLNLIHPLYPGTPLSSMYNVTLAVGGSLTGSQERNISLGYSIDLEHIPNQCAPFTCWANSGRSQLS